MGKDWLQFRCSILGKWSSRWCCNDWDVVWWTTEVWFFHTLPVAYRMLSRSVPAPDVPWLSPGSDSILIFLLSLTDRVNFILNSRWQYSASTNLWNSCLLRLQNIASSLPFKMLIFFFNCNRKQELLPVPTSGPDFSWCFHEVVIPSTLPYSSGLGTGNGDIIITIIIMKSLLNRAKINYSNT